MEFSLFPDMEVETEGWLLRVRVCRMWESINTKDNSLISMDMVLADEKDNLMHATVRKHLVPQFKHRLSEGLVYSRLRNVKVATNTYQYRPPASNQKQLFLATTEVVPLGEDAARILRYGFQFVDLPVLQSRADDMTTLSGGLENFNCNLSSFEGSGSLEPRSRKNLTMAGAKGLCSAWLTLKTTLILMVTEGLECFLLLKYDVETDRPRTKYLDTLELLDQLPALQQLLSRVLDCQPQGAAVHNFVIQLALSVVARNYKLASSHLSGLQETQHDLPVPLSVLP